MAYCDYRLCDVCGEKAFFDANLNYDSGDDGWNKDFLPFRIKGKEQHDIPEINAKHGLKLDRLGDWCVICSECAKTHKTAIVPNQ